MSRATDLIGALVRDTGPTAALRSRAAAAGRSVVLCEGEDPRVVAAALALIELGLARPLLLGDAARIRALAAAEGADPGRVEVLDPTPARTGPVAELLLRRRSHRGLQAAEAEEIARQPLFLGAGLVALGAVDAMVAGAVHPTSEVMRAGLWCVGPAPGLRTVSASFLMIPPDGGRCLLFADSAVVVEPDEDQLVDIGRASAATWRALFATEPRLAALSFSTRGSADHEAARRMARVAARLAEEGILADGELQADAALVEEVGRVKAEGSPVAGRADILLFPDLQAGNIGYKLVQRLAGYRAVGPLVQGLARPVFDLSRGCSAEEIVDTAAIAVLAAATPHPSS